MYSSSLSRWGAIYQEGKRNPIVHNMTAAKIIYHHPGLMAKEMLEIKVTPDVAFPVWASFDVF